MYIHTHTYLFVSFVFSFDRFVWENKVVGSRSLYESLLQVSFRVCVSLLTNMCVSLLTNMRGQTKSLRVGLWLYVGRIQSACIFGVGLFMSLFYWSLFVHMRLFLHIFLSLFYRSLFVYIFKNRGQCR